MNTLGCGNKELALRTVFVGTYLHNLDQNNWHKFSVRDMNYWKNRSGFQIIYLQGKFFGISIYIYTYQPKTHGQVQNWITLHVVGIFSSCEIKIHFLY